MRLYPLALIPLILSFIALGLSTTLEGIQLYLTIGVALATALVSAAILFTYGIRSHEAKQIPLENFSLWADVGEPVAELRRLSLGDNVAAAQIASTDLSSLSANAELLQSRAYMLVGRVGFEGLREEKIHRRVENLVNDIDAIIKKIRSARNLTSEFIVPIEQCAAQADRVANKFFEFEGGKPEIIYIYVEPLRRAAEKLSRDLRLASSNINKYLLWGLKAEVPIPPKVEVPAQEKVAPAPERVEAPPTPQPEVPAPPKAEPQPEQKPELPSEPIPEKQV